MIRPRALAAIFGAVAVVDCVSRPLHAATQTFTWVGSTSNAWTTDSNWNPSTTYPNNGNDSISDFDVNINAVTSPDVYPTLNTSVTIDVLSVASSATMIIGPAMTLSINGPTLSNSGLIQIDQNSSDAVMDFLQSTSISGTGAIELDDYSPFAIFESASTATVTIGSSQTIGGDGEIEANLVNNGTIAATTGSRQLLLTTDNITNNNVIESDVSGAILNITGITVTQSSTGTLSAGSGGSVNVNTGATISGGTISSDASSSVTVTNATFNSLTISGGTRVIVTGGNTLDLTGSTITNNGTITVDQDSSDADLNVAANLTLAGTGTVTLDDYSPFALLTTSGTSTLTIGASQTINGTGEITAALVNNGIIDANAGSRPLLLQTNNMSSSNLIESTAGGSTLAINGITLTQTSPGEISAAGGNVLIEGGATLSGGTLNANSGSLFTVTGATFSNVTITAGSQIVLASADTLNLTGTTITNNGTIQVDQDSSDADLNAAANITLAGTGTVTLDDYNPTARLTTSTSATLTIGASQTINGDGEIDALLINNGTVNATSNGEFIRLQTNNMSNNNLMEATGTGSSLVIDGIAVTQNSTAEVSAAGGSVILEGGATLSGGTLNANSGSAVTVTSGTLSNLTISTGSKVVIASADTLNLSGTSITNNGIIQVDTYSSNADLNAATSITLGGTGSVTLDDYSPNARITSSSGATLTIGAGQTINGIGEIDTALVNNGTITATVATHFIDLNDPVTGTGTLGVVSGATLATGTNIGNSVVGGLAISSTGQLNLQNNQILINYGSNPDPIASIAALIISGYNHDSWNGEGIMSSAAASNSASYGIGYADSADPGNPADLATHQIKIMYTLLGDANLDGKVNGADFTLMAANFNHAVTNGWDEGDFNYDGAVNGSDFVLLSDNFNEFASQSAVTAANLQALNDFAAANGISLTDSSSVPEPTTAALTALITGALALRRRNTRVHPPTSSS